MCSTGEIDLADHMRAAKRGERTMAEQELRLLDLPADAGSGFGAWQALHNMASPAAISDSIKSACAVHYGHAGPAFVRGLVADPAHWDIETKRLAKAFAGKAKQEGDTAAPPDEAFGGIARHPPRCLLRKTSPTISSVLKHDFLVAGGRFAP